MYCFGGSLREMCFSYFENGTIICCERGRAFRSTIARLAKSTVQFAKLGHEQALQLLFCIQDRGVLSSPR